MIIISFITEDNRAGRHHKKEEHDNYSAKEGRSDPRTKGKDLFM